jgi:hypothetical protein
LVDWDHDGRTDVLSGSWPGEVYLFRRQADGSLAEGETLNNAAGEPVNVGSAAAAHAADWNGDGFLDLLIGVIDGNVYFVPRQKREDSLILGEPQRLELTLPAEQTLGDAGPVAADWDADGLVDLLVGAADGCVWWFRNTGRAGSPQLAEGKQIIPTSPLAGHNPAPQEGDWGTRVKLCAADFNRDGRLDLLMGDYCGDFEGKPAQTPAEQAEEQIALARLPQLRKAWANVFAAYRKSLRAAESREEELESLRTELSRLKDEIAACEAIQFRYEPQRQSHGYVWLWLRKSAATR